MFVIKYDKMSMVRLVKSIEKHPAIYDTKKHYSKEEQDSAWDKVALAVGEKDSLCRDRWHSIKSCYIRHLKQTILNTKRRPYYLADELDFMLPHVVDRVKVFLESKNFQLDKLPAYLREALPKKEPVIFKTDISSRKNVVIKEEVVDDEENDADWLCVTQEIIAQPSSSKKSNKRVPAACTTSVSASKKLKTLKVESPCKKVEPKPVEDDDVKFFRSLMPDVERMSSHQKLKFKQEALSIIEDILYATEETEDVNIMD